MGQKISNLHIGGGDELNFESDSSVSEVSIVRKAIKKNVSTQKFADIKFLHDLDRRQQVLFLQDESSQGKLQKQKRLYSRDQLKAKPEIKLTKSNLKYFDSVLSSDSTISLISRIHRKRGRPIKLRKPKFSDVRIIKTTIKPAKSKAKLPKSRLISQPIQIEQTQVHIQALVKPQDSNQFVRPPLIASPEKVIEVNDTGLGQIQSLIDSCASQDQITSHQSNDSSSQNFVVQPASLDIPRLTGLPYQDQPVFSTLIEELNQKLAERNEMASFLEKQDLAREKMMAYSQQKGLGTQNFNRGCKMECESTVQEIFDKKELHGLKFKLARERFEGKMDHNGIEDLFKQEIEEIANIKTGASFQSFKTSANEETPSNRDCLKPPKLYDWELGSDNEWRRVPGPKKKYFREKPFVSSHAPNSAAATGFLVPSSSKIANDETISDFRLKTVQRDCGHSHCTQNKLLHDSNPVEAYQISDLYPVRDKSISLGYLLTRENLECTCGLDSVPVRDGSNNTDREASLGIPSNEHKNKKEKGWFLHSPVYSPSLNDRHKICTCYL